MPATAVVLLVLATRLAFAAEGESKAATFARCFEIHNCLAVERTSWEFFTDDLASCLKAARVWWSNKPAGLPVTLVTQLSIARLDQLKAQCATWRGPLAAAVFLSLTNPEQQLQEANQQKLSDAISDVDSFFRASEANVTHGCQLRLVLMYELFNSTRAATMLYPVNSLRNYARLMADTDLITNIDVDLLPSVSISDALADPEIRASYTDGCTRGALYVWPAFQTHCNNTEYADAIAVGGRQALQQGLANCVKMFEYKYPIFHGPTKHARWLESSEVYQVQYAVNYEPWYMSWRWETPWFDYRYRGYGFNKIVQAAAMNATGAKWFVSPHGFVIHRPHNETNMRKQFIHDKAHRLAIQEFHRTMFGHVAALWEEAQAHMAAFGRFETRVEDSFRMCMRSLPWWRREANTSAAAAADSHDGSNGASNTESSMSGGRSTSERLR